MTKKENVKRILFLSGMCLMILLVATVPCFAAGSIESSISAFSKTVRAIVKGIGGIAVLIGIVQFGIALKSHDASQKSSSLLFVAGGLVIFFAPEMVDQIS